MTPSSARGVGASVMTRAYAARRHWPGEEGAGLWRARTARAGCGQPGAGQAAEPSEELGVEAEAAGVLAEPESLLVVVDTEDEDPERESVR